jgi:hypothetical protein
VLPQQLHVVPIVDYSVGNGVFELVESSLVGIELLSDVGVELIRSIGYDNLVLWPGNSE